MTSVAADIDPAVEQVVRRCLDPDPAKRPATAAERAGRASRRRSSGGRTGRGRNAVAGNGGRRRQGRRHAAPLLRALPGAGGVVARRPPFPCARRAPRWCTAGSTRLAGGAGAPGPRNRRLLRLRRQTGRRAIWLGHRTESSATWASRPNRTNGTSGWRGSPPSRRATGRARSR